MIFVVLLGTPIALFLLIASPRASAVKLLKQLNSIRVNRTHFQQAERLAAQFGGQAACVGDNCLFQFQNLWLHRLHLAPLTEFTVMLVRGGSPSDPGGGSIGAVDMAMLVNAPAQAGPIASALVFERAGGRSDTPYQASVTIASDGHAGRTVVVMTPAASAREKARARAFNLRCLTRLGGCKSSRDLLPGVWSGARRIERVQAGAPASMYSATWRTSAARN
ncbi:MAG: hypothetical protein ACREPW_08170 [Candidatus Binataceae bacterium]